MPYKLRCSECGALIVFVKRVNIWEVVSADSATSTHEHLQGNNNDARLAAARSGASSLSPEIRSGKLHRRGLAPLSRAWRPLRRTLRKARLCRCGDRFLLLRHLPQKFLFFFRAVVLHKIRRLKATQGGLSVEQPFIRTALCVGFRLLYRHPSENLQDVPIVVSNISGEALATSGGEYQPGLHH